MSNLLLRQLLAGGILGLDLDAVLVDVGSEAVQKDLRHEKHLVYRGTSFIRNTPFPGPYSRNMSKVLRWF